MLRHARVLHLFRVRGELGASRRDLLVEFSEGRELALRDPDDRDVAVPLAAQAVLAYAADDVFDVMAADPQAAPVPWGNAEEIKGNRLQGAR